MVVCKDYCPNRWEVFGLPLALIALIVVGYFCFRPATKPDITLTHTDVHISETKESE